MFNSLPKLSEVVAKDELRPMMCHAWMNKKHIYASNTYILVRLNTDMHFDEKQRDFIPDTGFYLDIYMLRALQRPYICSAEIAEIITYPDKKIQLIDIQYEKRDERILYPLKLAEDIGQAYPNAESVISEIYNPKEWTEINQITFKGDFMYRLQKGLGDTALNFYFNGAEKGTCVLPRNQDLVAEGRIGVIMPMLNPE